MELGLDKASALGEGLMRLPSTGASLKRPCRRIMPRRRRSSVPASAIHSASVALGASPEQARWSRRQRLIARKLPRGQSHIESSNLRASFVEFEAMDVVFQHRNDCRLALSFSSSMRSRTSNGSANTGKVATTHTGIEHRIRFADFGHPSNVPAAGSQVLVVSSCTKRNTSKRSRARHRALATPLAPALLLRYRL